MRINVVLFEGFLAVVLIGLGIYWFRNPGSNVEPVTVIVGGVLVIVDGIRRRRKDETGAAAPPIEAPKEVEHSPDGAVAYLPDGTGSRALFSQRFGYAFPGVRDVTWYEGKVAADRLETLLADPLSYSPGTGRAPPFWWWRGGNLHIQSFVRVDRYTALMNWDELKIRRIAAVPNVDYRRCWVYVETDGMPATGLYEPLDAQETQDRIDMFGYAWEEYAIFRGHMIRREEYDDGAATIKGSIVRLNGEAKLRVRYLTPYNFVVAPIASQFNNNRFDQELKSMLNGLLKGGTDFSELVEKAGQLPLPTRFED